MINKIANITFKSTQEDTSHKTRLNSNLAVTGACSGLTTIGLGECFNKFDIAEFSKNTVEPLDTAEESSIPTPRKI